ncbi:hypothetical protein F4677DRAFT_414369 [Hypoxylon crocopeplum]|nr:hypothetical protein F4677DRAFT_414369 [Hypoxylon crocopeplum]
MARLAHLPRPPSESLLDQWRRSINKRFGRPATPNVAVLASMLVALRDASTTALGTPNDRVAVTYPTVLTKLTDVDVTDALDYANLRPWLGAEPAEPHNDAGMNPSRLSEACTVAASHGLGLCSNFKDLFECWEEEQRMPTHTVLLAGLTRRDLRAEVVQLRAPFHWYQTTVAQFVDLEAGTDAMDRFPSPTYFWRHVRKQVQSWVGGLPTRLTQVMLVGENATEPGFLAVLKDALLDYGHSPGGIEGQILLQDNQGNQETMDPVFASARGSAQYARWRQEAPIGCKERKVCEEKRERSRREGLLQKLNSERVDLR